MYQLKKKIEDIFLKLLLKKDFHEIEIIEIQKKSRISSKKFFQLFKTKEEIMISFFKCKQRRDLYFEITEITKSLQLMIRVLESR